MSSSLRAQTVLDGEDATWFAEECKRRNVRPAELLRQLVASNREAPRLPAKPGRMKVEARKAAFVRAVEDKFNLLPACKMAGIAPSTVYQWQTEDPEFAQAVSLARQSRVDEAEEHLWRQAKGEAKGNVTATLALLNAHNPAYGRIRSEVMQRVLGPFLEAVMDVVRQYLPKQTADALGDELHKLADRAVRATG